jgi:hypothetical protein
MLYKGQKVRYALAHPDSVFKNCDMLTIIEVVHTRCHCEEFDAVRIEGFTNRRTSCGTCHQSFNALYDMNIFTPIAELSKDIKLL